MHFPALHRFVRVDRLRARQRTHRPVAWFLPALVMLGLLAPVPAPAGASVAREETTGVRASVWSAVPNRPSTSVPTRDPVPVATTAPFVDVDVRCTWVGHVLRRRGADAAQQAARCNRVLDLFRPARAYVDRLVGVSSSRGIELVLLEDPINAAQGVPAQTTAIRPGTVACYPPDTFEDGDPPCNGLPAVGALNDIGVDWTCQIDISGDFFSNHPKVQKSSLAHEYFHCQQRERSPQSVTSFTPSRPWLVEGSAAWVGEQYADGSPISGRWWNQAVHASDSHFSDQCPPSVGPPTGCVFGRRAGYAAHAFFFALASGRGDATVAAAALAALGAGDDASAMALLAGPSDPVWLQWAGFARLWAEGGLFWTLVAPGLDQAPRNEWRQELELVRVPQFDFTAEPTENKIIDVSWRAVRAGQQHLVVELDGVAVLRWTANDGSPVGPEVTNLGIPQRLEVCIQGCQAGETPPPPRGATGFVIAISGTGSTRSRVRAAVTCPAARTSSSSPISAFATSAPISRCCLVGDWVMSQAPTYARFRTINGGVGQTMTIEPDGRLVADYDPMVPWEVEDTSDASGGTVVMKLNGQATATIDLERLVTARRLRKVETDFSGVTVSASVRFPGEGELDFGTQPFSEWFGIVVAIAGEPPPETGVGLECSATTLKLTDSASGISHEFSRVSEPVCDGRSCSTRRRDPA